MRFLRGARPSKRHKLQAQNAFRFSGTLPPWTINSVPTRPQMDGNDRYGDCTCACLGNVIDVVKRILGVGGGPIPSANVVSWAISHGFQDGAEIIDVLDALATDPMIDGAGNACLIGPNSGVDYTDTESVYAALAYHYALDLGVDAQPFEDASAGNSPVCVIPVLTQRYANIDHSVPAFDFGTASILATSYAEAYGVSVSLGEVGDGEPCLGIETWGTLCIVPVRSFELLAGEAHVIEKFPAPMPPPSPPSPTPSPSWRAARLAHGAAERGAEGERAIIEEILEFAERKLS